MNHAEEKARLVLETEATRHALAEKLSALGEAVTGAVAEAKDSIGDAVTRVSPKHQIQEHPIPALLVSVGGGILVGTWLARKNLDQTTSAGPDARGVPRGSGFLAAIGRELIPEVKAAKGLVTAYAFQRLSEWVRTRNPKLSDTIDEIERGFLQHAVPKNVEKGSNAVHTPA